MIIQAPEMYGNGKRRTTHRLFDHLINNCGFKNDADIAKKLKTTAPIISRTRVGYFKVGPTMILAVYDATDMSIEEIRGLL